MPRRIEVELTSARDDGSWTWRAAGARQPKGVLDGSLLPGGAKVGDVLRADAEFDVDGITVVAVLPPREARPEGATAAAEAQATPAPAGPSRRRPRRAAARARAGRPAAAEGGHAGRAG